MRVLQVFLVFVCLLSISFSQMKDHKVTLRQDKFLTEEQGKQELMNFAKSYSTKAQWEKRADNIRKHILVGAELYPMPKKTALKPIITSKRTHDGYTVENVAFESMPGFFVTGNLYRPTKEHKSYAVILCPHGHFFPDSVSGGGRFRKDMQIRCATFAKMGALVFAYDMVGWGESTQFENFQFPQSHDSLRKEVKYQLWNSIRAVDFMLTLKGADPKRIGVTGASGGGTQTFLLAAVDNRVSVSVPVVMVASHFFGGCICESGMPIHQSTKHLTNNADIAALFAPKPMLLVSDGDDWTKNNPEVEYPYIRNVYKLYGAEDVVKNSHFPKEGHDYGKTKRAPVYPFMAKHLKLDLTLIQDASGKIDESFVTFEQTNDMKVFTEKNPRPAYAIRAIEDLK
ncbi:acetylxylan esterase [bacterium]|nr:MAG: acetylxylan esterase [bacterium]